MADPIVNDPRSVADFKTITFHEYTKAEAKRGLVNCIQDSDQDEALYWAIELLCSGLIDSLWRTILDSIVMHVHRVNPKLLLYALARHSEIDRLRSEHELEMTSIRNSSTCRFIIVEAVALACASRKARLPTWPVIPDVEDLEALQGAITSPARHFADAVLKKDDPEDVLIAANEVAYALHSERRNAQEALYWIRWLVTYDRRLKVLKDPLECAERPVPDGIDPKHNKDAIWLVWELLNHASSQRRQPALDRIIQCLFTLYVHQWEPGSKWARKHYIAAAVAFLTDAVDWTEPICQDREAIRQTTMNIPQYFMEFLSDQSS